MTGSRFVDIPGGGAAKVKLSPAVAAQKTPGGSASSPGLISVVENWFRSRTGSVPSRPSLSARRRHRTQSEGEKDSPEKQEDVSPGLKMEDAKKSKEGKKGKVGKKE